MLLGLVNGETAVTAAPYTDAKFIEELDRLTASDLDSFERQTIIAGLQDNVSQPAYQKANDALKSVVKAHEIDFHSLKLARSIDDGIYDTIRVHLRDVLHDGEF